MEKAFDYDEHISEPAWQTASDFAINVAEHFAVRNPHVELTPEQKATFQEHLTELMAEEFKEVLRAHYKAKGAQELG